MKEFILFHLLSYKEKIVMNKGQYIEQAIQVVSQSKIFNHPIIEFIMIDPYSKENQMIIGVMDNGDEEDRFIFKPHSKKKLIYYYDIHYRSKKQREMFDECIQGYILNHLHGGNELLYMNFTVHFEMWDFMETYLSECKLMITGIKKYLAYCIENGISKIFMDSHSSGYYPDFFYLFYNDTMEGYSNIVCEKIEDYSLCICYSGSLNPNTIFFMIVCNDETQSIEYKQHHHSLQNALDDFNRFFFMMNMDVAKRVEEAVEITDEYIHSYCD